MDSAARGDRSPLAPPPQLADELGVDPGDIQVLISVLDGEMVSPDGRLANELGAAIGDQIDHLCERTVPSYWSPGSDPDAGKRTTRMRGSQVEGGRFMRPPRMSAARRSASPTHAAYTRSVVAPPPP